MTVKPDDAHQFLSVRGLSINMCETLAVKKIQELGFIPSQDKRTYPSGLVDYNFEHPGDKFAVAKINAQKNFGDLELSIIRIYTSRPMTPNEIKSEADSYFNNGEK